MTEANFSVDPQQGTAENRGLLPREGHILLCISRPHVYALYVLVGIVVALKVKIQTIRFEKRQYPYLYWPERAWWS